LGLEFSSSPPPDTFSQQGKELRAELERIYRNRKEKVHPLSGIDVSSTIAKYVPLGTSLDDAERILKAAGFKTDSRPPHPIQKDSIVKFDEKHRLAWLGTLVLDQTFLVSSTTVIVVLSPDSPGDPKARVKEIQGSLHTTYL